MSRERLWTHFIIIGLWGLLLSSCAQLQRRTEAPPVTPEPAERAEIPAEEDRPPLEEELPPPPLAPKVGVVLGPGLINTYAHVGVLKAFHENKIPIQAIAGLEWGSLPAALFAMRGLAHDVEWKMHRLEREDLPDKGFFSSRIKARDIRALDAFFTRTVQGEQIQKSQVEFTCPSLVLDQGKVYWQRRGESAQVLAQCMAFPPYFESGQGVYAAPFSLEEAAAQVRSRGAEIVVYVDVLSGSPLFRKEDRRHYLPEYLLWSEVAAQSSRDQIEGVDHIIHVRTSKDIYSFESRRSLVDRGLQSARPVLKQLANQYAF